MGGSIFVNDYSTLPCAWRTKAETSGPRIHTRWRVATLVSVTVDKELSDHSPSAAVACARLCCIIYARPI